MKIRKFTYTIAHIHVLTFKDHIKAIIAPYFAYEPLEYGVDNEGTLQENVRLIFRNAGFIMQFNKELATLLYEGDIMEVKKHNPVIDIFFEIYEKIKKIDGFVKVKSHNLSTDSIKLFEKTDYLTLLENNKYLWNPYKNVEEFATILEFQKEGKYYRLQFGNYNEKDIAKLNLLPLKVNYNKDMFGSFGLLGQLLIREDVTTPTFTKLKTLIIDTENTLNQYLATDE